MQSNVTVVTPPDIYYAKAPSILCIGCDDYIENILDNVRRLPVEVTMYTTNKQEDLEWISTAYHQADISILNCAYNETFLGFFIDKSQVYYYNNKQSYKRFNLNEVKDPMDPLIKWMTKWQDHKDKLEKNKDYMSK
jgi:hypothetical protein